MPSKVNTIQTAVLLASPVAGTPVSGSPEPEGFPAEPASFPKPRWLLDGFRHRVYLCLFRDVFIPYDSLDRRLHPGEILIFLLIQSFRLPDAVLT